MKWLIFAILLVMGVAAKPKKHGFLVLCETGYITRDGDSVSASGNNCVIHSGKEAASAASITIYDNMNGP